MSIDKTPSIEFTSAQRALLDTQLAILEKRISEYNEGRRALPTSIIWGPPVIRFTEALRALLVQHDRLTEQFARVANQWEHIDLVTNECHALRVEIATLRARPLVDVRAVIREVEAYGDAFYSSETARHRQARLQNIRELLSDTITAEVRP